MVAGSGPPHDLAMTTDRIAHNKQLVNDFIQDLFSKGDLSAVDRYLHPQFISHDPPFPGAPDGPEGMRLAAATFRQAFRRRGAHRRGRPRRRAVHRQRDSPSDIDGRTTQR
jgi:SnoaL-like polyketide cyclase